jgi:16S rRNA (guanine527-N7)-methyltransferase
MPTPVPPPTDRFHELCRGYGIEPEPDEISRLGEYLDLLYETNEVTNLTAVRDPGEAWVRHIFDALTLLPVLAEALASGQRLRVCDVGAGGGVPGIPLAIVMPRADVTLLEATGRKCEFLHAAIASLGLSNAAVVNGRSERVGAFPGGPLRDSFDVVTARALGRIAVASELCLPLARVGGLVVLVKGQKADEELDEAGPALHALHAGHAGTIDTPTGRLVVLEKHRPTPKIYPRRDGEPKRAPIGVRRDAGSE